MQIKIIGNTYQPFNATVDGKMFFAPTRGQSKLMTVEEIPSQLLFLQDKKVITIQIIQQ